MQNIHLKNLNSEKTLKELAKNPKAYLFYVFQQNINNNYPALYQFKKLPIKEATKPTYEKLPEKPSYLTDPSKPSYPDFSPTKLPEKPLPTKPVKEQLPEKPNYKKELEKPKQIPNNNNEIKKEPIKITKYEYEYEKTSSATSLKVRKADNKRSASGNSLTIKRI